MFEKQINELLALLKINQMALHDSAVRMSNHTRLEADYDMDKETINYRVTEEEIYDIIETLSILNTHASQKEIDEKLHVIFESTTSGELYTLLIKLMLFDSTSKVD